MYIDFKSNKISPFQFSTDNFFLIKLVCHCMLENINFNVIVFLTDNLLFNQNCNTRQPVYWFQVKTFSIFVSSTDFVFIAEMFLSLYAWQTIFCYIQVSMVSNRTLDFKSKHSFSVFHHFSLWELYLSLYWQIIFCEIYQWRLFQIKQIFLSVVTRKYIFQTI